MKRISIISLSIIVSLIMGMYGPVVMAQERTVTKLPEPRKEGGLPLMEVLAKRQTQRAFSDKELPPEVLSDLLWAACGINRPESGKRTAPSAMNMQEIDVYVAKADGVYLYIPLSHSLELITPLDLRASTGKQEFVAIAPVNLIFIADSSRMDRVAKEEQHYQAACDTGYISQNVYLYCTSAGLSTVARGWVDKVMLAEALKLKDSQEIILAQTVGYPAE